MLQKSRGTCKETLEDYSTSVAWLRKQKYMQ